MRLKPLYLFVSLIVFAFLHFGFKSKPGDPPTILSFTAEPLKNQARVKWTAVNESDLKEYRIYRSIDEQNWFLMWQMPAKNRKSITHYEFVDRSVAGGVNFYKLESVTNDDKNSILKYTKVDQEDLTKAVDLTIDIETGKIRLASAEQLFSIELELTDIMERTYPISFLRDSSHEIIIITGPMEHGTYYLKCYINKERYVRKKAIF